MNLVGLVDYFPVDIDRALRDGGAVVLGLPVAELGAENFEDWDITPSFFGPRVICLMSEEEKGVYVEVRRNSSVWTVYDPVPFLKDIGIPVFWFDKMRLVGSSALLAGWFCGRKRWSGNRPWRRDGAIDSKHNSIPERWAWLNPHPWSNYWQ